MRTKAPGLFPPYDQDGNRRRVDELRAQGVEVWGPERVYVGPEVPLQSIEPGAVLIQATVLGERCYISSGALIGTSGPAILENTQVGAAVELGAGSYRGATLLAGAKARGFAELRSGTLLEEEAEVAHNVGLKNTIFTVAVVAGSNVNFCDVLISGGTSRVNHSEIGSGAVHFNFAPNRDKFGSLLGDSTGVLLRSAPIFIGGNSGIVAPVSIGFGAVIPAGVTVRTDVEAGKFYAAQQVCDRAGSESPPQRHKVMERKFRSTATLIGNLHGLALWYRHVRYPYATGGEPLLLEAAIEQIRANIAHRVRELGRTASRLAMHPAATGEETLLFTSTTNLATRNEEIQYHLLEEPALSAPQELMEEYRTLRTNRSHIEAIGALSEGAVTAAAGWLRHITRRTESAVERVLS